MSSDSRSRKSSSSKSRKSKHKNYDSDEAREGKSFSFNDHKRRLNFILQNYDLLHKDDEKEFWLFVLKLEKKFSTQFNVVENRCQNSICFNLNIPEREAKKKEKSSKPLDGLDDNAIQIFLNIFEAFLNFKQTRKFQQLKKIRKAQRELPVANYEDEIINTVRESRVVIIAGDTGCGKSTQIPQYFLNHKFGNVVCTQPRRLACTSLCARLKYETLTRHRNEIGYQIRFEKKRNKDTKVLFLTEGLLLRQISSDPNLLSHDVIILDEIHERHIETDFLLGLLKCILAKPVELKIVLMSATINIELFSNYFGSEAKILKIPGRCYPVQVMYRPIPVVDKELNKKQKINLSSYLQIVQIVDEKYKDEKGDILIFVSGMFEIERLVEAINEYSESKNGGWIVLPLHSSLSATEQDKVFDYAPEGYRKCIISTNIAETSVTIDGIRFVIDSGKAKEMSYDSVFKIQRLQEFWVSRSSAEQRKGRAGRTGPGFCYRLYSEEDYASFEDYTTPEIKRAPLDSVLLQVIAMGLPDVRKFPFLEEPKKEEIENCIISLKFQNALKEDEKITEIGKMLSNLPVDLTIGKMLIIGAVFEKAEAAVALASVLSVPSPYTNRAFRNLDCESERKEFESDHGDGITLINLFSQWLRLKRDRENTKHWCRKAGLEEQRFYEMVKLRDQFREILIDKELLETKGESLSASERKIRHGEIRLLKRMRHSRQEEHQTRKKLKVNADEEEASKDDFDAKDIEFRLRTDRGKIIDILDSIRNDFRKNLTLMKIIYCSGLYPQFAVADEFNYIKTEQIFHTKNKSHVFLHPLSMFGLHPDVLKIEEQDIVIPNNKTQYKGKHFSSKHKTLCYLNLLETNKIYLTNIIRMPALQSFVFFAKTVDVSFDCTRIICDNWVLFEILNGRQADVFLIQLIRLRKIWNRWINSKLLKNNLEKNYKDPTDEITKFFNSDICYTYKRLLPADLKYLYVKRKSFFELKENFFDRDFIAEENAVKGGTKVTEYLTYDCVSAGSYDKEPFECSVCDFEFEFDCFERIEHRSKCKKTDTLSDSGALQFLGRKSNATEFNCSVCNKVYYFTSVEALRHKKSCKS